MRNTGRIGCAIAAALLAAAGVARADEGGDRKGQDLWRSCAACHCVPDGRIPEDADWLTLNETTTCIAGENDTPEHRKALIAYLTAKETLRPRLIDAEHPAPAGKTLGAVRLPATAGSAYLKAERASVRAGAPPKIRLRWEKSETGTTLRVPAGTYRVVSYAFYRVDGKGRRWTASGSSAEGCAQLSVAKGKEAALDLRPEIQAHLGCKQGRIGLILDFFMTNRHGQRMSLVRDAKLVDPGWVVLREDGEEIRSGKFVVS